ncbi:hypothetical protein ABZ769_16150 [Streptomyces olivoreticuli]
MLARYTRTDDPAATLSLSGAYGRVGDPATVLDGMLNGFESGPGSPEVTTPRRNFTPTGGPSLSCEVVRLEGRTYAPACAWAEKTDAALLISFDPKRTTPGAAEASAFAQLTADVYRSVRSPVPATWATGCASCGS